MFYRIEFSTRRCNELKQNSFQNEKNNRTPGWVDRFWAFLQKKNFFIAKSGYETYLGTLAFLLDKKAKFLLSARCLFSLPP